MITVFNMKEYTKQQIFDQAMELLLKQGGPAGDLKTMDALIAFRCKYRAGNGRMCIVGGMIPDENYLKTYENLPAMELLKEMKVLSPEGCEHSIGSTTHEWFLHCLQRLHDKAAMDAEDPYRGEVEDTGFFSALLNRIDDFTIEWKLTLDAGMRARLASAAGLPA